MTTVAISRRETSVTASVTTDRALLRAFLERDRIYAAYAICDLDDREFPRTRWGAAWSGGSIVAVVLEYTGGSPQPLFAMGREDGVAALFRDVVRPRLAYVAALPSLLPTIQARYRLDAGPQMVRMAVDRQTFRSADDPGVERLVPADVIDRKSVV